MNNLERFIAEHRMARNLSLCKLGEIANLSLPKSVGLKKEPESAPRRWC